MSSELIDKDHRDRRQLLPCGFSSTNQSFHESAKRASGDRKRRRESYRASSWREKSADRIPTNIEIVLSQYKYRTQVNSRMQQIALISTLVAVAVAQFGGYQPQQGNNGFGGGSQQQQQGGFMPQGQQQWGQQGQQQQWGGDRGMMNGGMDRMMGGMGGMGGRHQRGPPFLQNVTRQAVSEYYQIYMNRNLTKAQIQTAVGNWSTTYNVADQVTAYNTQKQQAQQQGRQNVTAAVQQLPSTLTQIYSIMDNQNLTMAQEHQQIGQIFANLTYPLNMLTGSALQGGKRGKGMGGGRRGDDEDSGEELIIFGF